MDRHAGLRPLNTTDYRLLLAAAMTSCQPLLESRLKEAGLSQQGDLALFFIVSAHAGRPDLLRPPGLISLFFS